MEYSLTNLLYVIVAVVAVLAFNVYNGLGFIGNVMIDICLAIIAIGYLTYRSIFMKDMAYWSKA